MRDVFNFSAGPAILPESVLQKAADEMLDYKDSGMSIMEMSHRGKEFKGVIEKAEADLREIMDIPGNYKVLFVQGGASLQFSMIPLNIMNKNKRCDFINTGQWTKKAISEAKKFGTVNVIATSENDNFTQIPDITPEMLSKDADYLHIATNNTIYGTAYNKIPDTGGVALVADMSSNILSAPIDVSKFGIIFAGAQKNIGPAGVTIVIIREDLIGHADEKVPALLDYKTYADAGSMYNTPPCYSIYIAGLVFEWIKEKGGLAAMEKLNKDKANLLYDYIDSSDLFSSPVKKEDRSLMNIPFVTGNDKLDEKFIKQAAEKGLKTLKGHRSVGGMRASIYNAMPVEGVKRLVEFMKEFEKENK